jgi:alpha-1,2-mannosyltransferase
MIRSSAIPVWSKASPLMRGLMIFAGLYLAISFVQWFLLGHLSTLNVTRLFLVWHNMGAFDSWQPMQRALQYFQSGADKTMYAAVFFEQKEKFQYPLLSLILIWPFAKLPYDAATSNYMLNVTSWLAVVVTVVIVAAIFDVACRRYLKPGAIAGGFNRPLAWAVCAVLTITYLPIVQSYEFGQIQTWINGLFAALVLAWMLDRKAAAGLIAAVICVIKPQLALLLLWGVLRRQWRFVIWFAGAGVVFAILSIAIFGLDNNLDYLSVLSFLSRHGESISLNQSVNGLLNRIMHNGTILLEDDAKLGPGDWVPPFNPVIYAGTLVTTILIIGTALFWRVKNHEGAILVDLLIISLSLTIASPIAWTHHYGVLLPMFAVALPMTVGMSRFGAGSIIALGAAFLLTGNYLFMEVERSVNTPFNFIISYMFFGALLLLVHLYRLRGHLGSAPASLPASSLLARTA